MPSHHSIRRSRRADRGFSLVEVALALGIAGFALAGLIGAIPLASSVGQQSIAQSRAASIASTIFANLRAQRFSAAPYLDDGTTTVNLDSQSATLTYYAYFDETVTCVPSSEDERRLHFMSTAPTAAATGGVTNNSIFQITLHFNNNPAGTLAPYPTSTGATHAQANAIEASVFATAHPKDVYRFSTVVANRLD